MRLNGAGSAVNHLVTSRNGLLTICTLVLASAYACKKLSVGPFAFYSLAISTGYPHPPSVYPNNVGPRMTLA
jgi:hypothetical protein